MDIHFLPDAPGYRDANLTIEFAALVDGRRVPCAISVEALEDHFGVKSYDSDGWIGAFDAARERIEAVAREHLRVTNGMPVLLKSGHFRRGASSRESREGRSYMHSCKTFARIFGSSIARYSAAARLVRHVFCSIASACLWLNASKSL